MKPVVTSLAAIAAMAGLFGCQPDQEYRFAEACRESITSFTGQQRTTLEKSCSCLAKAAVQQLDHDMVEYMIAEYKDPGLMLRGDKAESMARAQTIVDFQIRNVACIRDLIVT